MKKLIIYSLLLFIVTGFYSCLDDKNNFDYKQVNELDGEILNIDIAGYEVNVGEELTISPTFKFTIDKENPDVSYEWYLDGKKLDVTTPSYTFSSDKYGIYELTYAVVDNKTGVKFSLSTKITVTSAYLKGWAILSDMNGRSALSFIKVKTVKKLYYDSDGREAYKDSIVYEEVEKDIIPDLGTEPLRLLESTGYWDLAYQDLNSGEEVLYDELVVMQGSKWVELNGNSLMKSVYTEEEFNGDIPDDFSPVDAVMTYSSKFLFNQNGYIYYNQRAVANDFHAGFYLSDPIWGGTRFKKMYGIQKFNDYMRTIPVLTTDNSLQYIWDGGLTYEFPTIHMNTLMYSGNVYEIVDDEGKGDSRFQNMEYEIINMLPASTEKDDWYDTCMPRWVALLKKDGNYFLRNFSLDTYYVNPPVKVGDYFEKNIKNATEAGVRVGVYFFTQATTPVEAVEEASMVLMLCNQYKISFPLYIDTEGAGGNGRADGLDVETRTAVCTAFCETIENAGYTAGVYASKNWLTGKLDAQKLSPYSVWLAQYSGKPSYQGTYDMWQYTSAGTVDGISTLVDFNVSYMDY